MALKDLPADAQPREKLLARGAAALADVELLALLLRTGIQGKGVLQLAQELLDPPAHDGTGGFGGIAGLLNASASDLVRRALHHQACSVVLTHNHPSGNVQPSRADQALTRTLKAALALVDVAVLDHIIVAPGAALSMAEQGLI